MKVCKFGGSSLADAQQIRKVCDIILADPERSIVVVSAPGKRHREDSKITDRLIALAHARISAYDGEEEMKLITDRFRRMAVELGLGGDFGDAAENELRQRMERNARQPLDLMDALKSAGEDICAKLVTLCLQQMGQDAAYLSPLEAGLIVDDSNPGRVRVLPESYARIRKTLEQRHGITVFPGFFGYSESGKIRCFPRGGSDISGAILAAAVDADVYENWTDVDSVYAVNPDLVRSPLPLKEISYDEMRELAYAGFTVLHEEALEPTAVKSIPINIRNTNNPHAPGSMIVPKRINYESVVTGIAGMKGFSVLHIYRYLMNQEVGYVLRVLEILKEFNVPFEHMPSSIDSITLVLRDQVFTPDKEKRILKRLQEALHPDAMRVEHGYAIVMIIGDAMDRTVGVTSRATMALSRAGINLDFIVQGVSQISVIFGISAPFCNCAVRELYKEFFLR